LTNWIGIAFGTIGDAGQFYSYDSSHDYDVSAVFESAVWNDGFISILYKSLL